MTRGSILTLTIGNDQGMRNFNDRHPPPCRRAVDYTANNINDMRRILGRSATNGGLAVGTTIDYAVSNINDMRRILGRNATDG